jgi:hypothetical protein
MHRAVVVPEDRVAGTGSMNVLESALRRVRGQFIEQRQASQGC